MMRRRPSARQRPGSLENRESHEKRSLLRMEARTASLAAEGGVEAVAGEAVSVKKVASGKVRRAAHRPRRASLQIPSVPRAKPARSRMGVGALLPRPLRTTNGSSGRSAKANLPTPYR
jgi:hypothetical protein